MGCTQNGKFLNEGVEMRDFIMASVMGISFFIGYVWCDNLKQHDIYESCKQSQEYRFNEKEAMTCNITTLEIKGK